VWRHCICSKLFEKDLLTVPIQNTNSSHQLIQNGVPQGEVWSVPLFLIAINDLTNCVTFPLTHRLPTNDYSVSLASSNHKLQLTLNKISSWFSAARGFRFSDKKTVLLIFRKSHSRPPPPPSSPTSPKFLNLPPIIHQIPWSNLPFQYLLDPSH